MLTKKLDSVARTVTALDEASTRFPTGLFGAARRFWYLYRRRRFSPKEIYFNQLLDPRISDEALDHYLSREELIALDRAHVLESYLCLTCDKSVFYAFCAASGFPVPELYAVFDLPSGRTPDGSVLDSREEWCHRTSS